MRITRRQWIGLTSAGVPALAAADAFLLEPGWMRLNRLRLARGVPACRLIHFTDLHYKGGESSLRALVDRINALKPDLVCLTGDLAEDRDRIHAAAEILRGIRAPLFGVPGNHERWNRPDFGKIAECFAATGGAWLMDEAAVRDRVKIVGIDGRPGQARPEPRFINIVLMHYPAWVERLGAGGFDLILAGHSHGGQVRLPLAGALVVPHDVGRYDLGLYRTPAGPLYVGAGVGWYRLRARFFCRPEIALIEI